jgi:hypothetical protein
LRIRSPLVLNLQSSMRRLHSLVKVEMLYLLLFMINIWRSSILSCIFLN